MENFEHLRRSGTVLLATRRRDGRCVPTPVNLAIDERGLGYFRTYPDTGKVKRIANFPDVRVAPCNRRGRPSGSDQPALAHLLVAAEAEHAAATLARRFRVLHAILGPVVDRVLGKSPVYYRLSPADEPTPWAA